MVDYGVSTRQQIGSWWSSSPGDLVAAKQLLDHRLVLNPHPEWKIPQHIDWDADPFGQKNWRFQFHCLKWLEPARRVAARGTDAEAEQARGLWNTVVSSWLHSNLMGDDRFAWMDMADGVRAIELVLGAPIVADELADDLVKGIEIHVERLHDPARRAIGNHALHQLQGLFVAARFLERTELARDTAQELKEFFANEYDAEGTNQEGAVSYHDLNYFWWSVALARLESEGFELGTERTVLDSARSNIVHFVRPDGYLETIGDTSDGKELSRDGRDETEFVLSSGERGSAPQPTVIDLAAGYSLSRSSWGTEAAGFDAQTFFSLRWGNNRAVHGHDDASSVTIFAGGVPWIVDPGMYAYQSDPMRTHFLSRQAHNVVLSTELSTRPDVPEMLWAHHDQAFDAYCVLARPYDGFTIYRTVLYARELNFFCIHDRVEVSTSVTAIPEFVQRWNFHPETQVEHGRTSAILTHGKNVAVMRWLKRPHLQLRCGEREPYAGWYSPKYGEVVEGCALDARSSQRGDLSWFTVISFDHQDVIPVSVTEKPQHAGLVVRLALGDRERIIDIAQSGCSLWQLT